MDCVLLGWPEDGPTLELDHREFAYAGRFRVANTGKAVALAEDAEAEDWCNEDRAPDDTDNILAATAFNKDRSDAGTLKIRTVTVRRDCRGEGIGPDLLTFTRERGLERDYERVVISVNNPFAYEAAVRAGFGYTGEETGIAEVVMAWPVPEWGKENSDDRYEAGLRRFRDRDLEPAEERFLDRKLGETGE